MELKKEKKTFQNAYNLEEGFWFPTCFPECGRRRLRGGESHGLDPAAAAPVSFPSLLLRASVQPLISIRFVVTPLIIFNAREW